jgi:hypothetical protein
MTVLPYRQTAPIYGENSAPSRWGSTIAPWLCSDEVGLQCGQNEPCAYVHPSRELLALLYVDDCIQDGEYDDIEWLSTRITGRFDCKGTEWLCIDEPLDILGVTTSMDEQY